MNQCEFCREFEGHSPRLEGVYGTLLSTRIILKTDRFVVLPTLGQIFAGSLLILPIDHMDTFAQLTFDAKNELEELISNVVKRVSQYGHPIIFEHGATESTGGGCGIYHAHLHLVPAPEATMASTLFPEHQSRTTDIFSAWNKMRSASEYLLMSAGGETLYSDLSKTTDNYPSQFFRRRITEHFHLSAPWDWRAYTKVEPALLATIAGRLPTDAQ